MMALKAYESACEAKSFPLGIHKIGLDKIVAETVISEP